VLVTPGDPGPPPEPADANHLINKEGEGTKNLSFKNLLFA